MASLDLADGWLHGLRVSFAVTSNDNGLLFPLKPKEARINIPVDSNCFAQVIV